MASGMAGSRAQIYDQIICLFPSFLAMMVSVGLLLQQVFSTWWEKQLWNRLPLSHNNDEQQQETFLPEYIYICILGKILVQLRSLALSLTQSLWSRDKLPNQLAKILCLPLWRRNRTLELTHRITWSDVCFLEEQDKKEGLVCQMAKNYSQFIPASPRNFFFFRVQVVSYIFGILSLCC